MLPHCECDPHSTFPDYLSLAIHISGKILGSIDTIICGVALHWHSYTHGPPLKIEIVYDGLFQYE